MLMCVLSVVALSRLFFAARVSGHSMAPTLRNGDCILGIRIPSGHDFPLSHLKVNLLTRGAIVLARPCEYSYRLIVKRIDALPGDVRRWGWRGFATGPRSIPDGCVFLVGDASRDRKHSMTPSVDSRLFGPFSTDAVVARAFLRFWPVARFHWLQ